MAEWFRTAFGAEYLSLYAHRDEKEARQCVELIVRTTGAASHAAVLDAPCGAGRHLRAFASAGFRAAGIDLSPDLVSVAAESGSPVFRADLRALPFAPSSFTVVANLFSSFGYMETDEQNAAVMHELSRVCRPGGWLVIDFLNEPQVRRNLQPESSRTSSAGCTVHDKRWISESPSRVNKETLATSSTGETKALFESVRLFKRWELEEMMVGAGLTVSQVYGDYNGREWSVTSPRLILMGKKL